jgi:hypothetical protein
MLIAVARADVAQVLGLGLAMLQDPLSVQLLLLERPGRAGDRGLPVAVIAGTVAVRGPGRVRRGSRSGAVTSLQCGGLSAERRIRLAHARRAS